MSPANFEEIKIRKASATNEFYSLTVNFKATYLLGKNFKLYR